MGCYGIGVSRVVAASIEQNHDDSGIIWPEAIAPFAVGIVAMKVKNEEVQSAAEALYADLQSQGVEVLYDDRDVSPGQKFNEMDLIGLPWQCVVGPKGIANGVYEWKNRSTGEKQELPIGQYPQNMLNLSKTKAA
jgi:prolyl-tRNA synthetase